MRHIALGEEGAFAALYDRYSPRMHRFFCRMFGNDTAKANDLTQDLFLKIIEKPHRFDAQKRFSTWLYAVASNLCKNEFRRRPIMPDTFLPDLPDEADLRFSEPTDRADFEQHLQAAIQTLDEPHLRCFLLRYTEDLSIRDIADIENIPEGTVKSRLHYALRHLRQHLRIWTCTTT